MPRVPKKGSKKPWIVYADLGNKRQTFKGNEHEDAHFYNSRTWRKLRRYHLMSEPMCRKCGQVANVVDHITPIRHGGERLDENNLQSMCTSCHNKKSRSERGKSKKNSDEE